MLEVGWSELLVIAIVMIVVVGPKDLPKMLRTFASFAKKARGMANEFQSQFTDAMRDAELDDVRKTIADVRSLNPKNALRDALDPIRKAGEDVKRELQGVKDTTQNSISGAPASTAPNSGMPISGIQSSSVPTSNVTSAPVMAAPSAEPVIAPPPSVTLPLSAPAELAPVVAKVKAAPKKPPVAKADLAKKPKITKQIAKKTEAKV